MHYQGIPLMKYVVYNVVFVCFPETRDTKGQHYLSQGVYSAGALQISNSSHSALQANFRLGNYGNKETDFSG